MANTIGNFIAQHNAMPAAPQQMMTDKAVEYQQKLKNDMLNGKPVKLVNGTIVPADAQNQDIGTEISPAKLAVLQWYESDKSLLADETEAMSFHYPGFQLLQLPDRRLAWQGVVAPNLATGRKWEILAIYNNNHPVKEMGTSVRVFLVNPTIDDLINRLGFHPHHLLHSESDGIYLCSIESSSVKDGQRRGERVTSALNSVMFASKWLLYAEFVLLGLMSREEFNTRT